MTDNKFMFEIDSWLPVFTGFYNTIYDLTNNHETLQDSILSLEKWDNLKEEHAEYLTNYVYDYIDNSKLETDVVLQFIETLQEKFKENDLNIKIEFQDIISPKYYNYSNDSVDVRFIFDIETYNKIKELIHNNLYDDKINFKDFIRNEYTSCDGFMSNYSNNYNDWLFVLDNLQQIIETIDFKLEIKLTHFMGQILQFVCDVLNINDDNFEFYSPISENIYIGEYIKYDDFIKAFNEKFDLNIQSFNDLIQELKHE